MEGNITLNYSVDRYGYQSQKWLDMSARLKEERGHRCQDCRLETYDLDCHHLFYIRGRKAYDYWDYTILVLCRGCHAKRGTPSTFDTLLFKDHWEALRIMLGFRQGADGEWYYVGEPDFAI